MTTAAYIVSQRMNNAVSIGAVARKTGSGRWNFRRARGHCRTGSGRSFAPSAPPADRGGSPLDQLDDRQANGRLADDGKGLREPERAPIGDQKQRCGAAGWRSVLNTVEQRRHREAEDFGNADKPAAADAIGPFLVFLHLLESDAEPVGELRLGQAFGHAPNADIAAHRGIDRIRALGGHFARCGRAQRSPLVK